MAKEVKKSFDQKEKIEALALYFVIVNRDQSRYFIEKFNELGISMNIILYGYSSPPVDIASLLGPDMLKKDIILSFCKQSEIEKVHSIIEERFKISKLSKGIAFAVPIDSISGVIVYKFLVDHYRGK